jgi:hypothetical protein
MIISEMFGEHKEITMSFDTTTEVLTIDYGSIAKVVGDRNEIVRLAIFVTDIRKRVI